MAPKLLSITVIAICFYTLNAKAQFKINSRMIDAATKGFKALTFSDADAVKLAKDGVAWMDKNNKVADPKDPYTIRLNKIFGNHKNEDGLTLNYKVYVVKDINAFACADGSVRVFSSLMDIMTDEELLAIIGHEIGHVKNHDTRDAVKTAYTRAAIADAAASQSGTIATLNDSQLGEFANAFLESKHSRKQESEADIYSYEFLKRHNYDVMAEASAFNKFAKMEKEAGEKSTAQKMFSSHPDSKKRAETIIAKAKKDGLYKEPAKN